MESSLTRAKQHHLASCFPCRKGVNCVEWYRLHKRAPDWCAFCETEHFSTVADESPQFGDAITVVTPWTLYRELPRIERSFVVGSDSAISSSMHYEHVHWIRGHVGHWSDDAQALLAAATLTR